MSKKPVKKTEKQPDQKPNVPKRRGPDIEMIRRIQQERLQKNKEIAEEEERLRIEEQANKLEREKNKVEEEKLRVIVEEAKKEERKKAADVEKLSRVIGKFKISERFVDTNKLKDSNKLESEMLEINECTKSPIICILGHVDTGKTKILDKIRETNVQKGEAGGITQQIGATYFPIASIYSKYGVRSTLPGILIIDTPGHESFSNLRSRGSSLCNMAILVVDIMHLLEPQTLESIELLKMRKTPFVVALNKIDRIYGDSKSIENFDISTRNDFEIKLKAMVDETIIKFAQIGLNARHFNENPDLRKYISLVPTSAITGDGIGNLIGLIFKLCELYMKKISILSEDLQCVVLEVKVVEGFGTTIDCILVDGIINENDTICLAGFDGPIVTKIKSILVPQPMKEMRVNIPFKAVKSVTASMGIKIAAPDLDRAVAGSKIMRIEGDEEKIKLAVMEDFHSSLNKINTKEDGVHVQSSTLGSLEALISFLEKESIPIGSYGIGSTKKSDIVRVSANKKHKIMLCFDVEIDKELLDFAKNSGVVIFTASIIYHLVENYKKYIEEVNSAEKNKFSNNAIFPCELEIIPTCVFTTRTPLVMGVLIKRGKLTVNTPVFVNKDGIQKIGRVVSIENNKKNVKFAKKGEKVAIKIDSDLSEGCKMYGRHFNEKDPIYSMITRKSIDIIKEYFRDEIKEEEMKLIVELKKMLDIY